MRRLDLLGVLDRAYEHAFVLTYEFQCDFFERYCLEELPAFEQCANLNLLVDGRVFDRLLAGTHGPLPRRANVRYLLHPVRVPGAFHPKLYLFASKNKGLAIVGSANLTRPGLCTNAELGSVFTYEAGKEERHLPVFVALRSFVTRVVERWPSKDLVEGWEDLLGDARWFAAAESQPRTDLRVLDNLDSPLWEGIVGDLESPLRELHILSPYFDATPALLAQALDKLRPERTVLWTENDRTTMTPAWESFAAAPNKHTRIQFGKWEHEGHRQALHGKALALRHRRGWRLVWGSANFTGGGLRSTAASGNVELAIVLDGVAGRSFQAADLVDPGGHAGEEPLRPGTRLRPEPMPPKPVLLLEASLEDEVLRGRARLGEHEYLQWVAQLELGDGARYALPLSVAPGGELVAHMTLEICRRCAEESCLVTLISTSLSGQRLDSNPVLLLNLQDVDTGESVRRKRRVRDAQRSAAAFAERLDQLIRLGNDDEILRFLSYVDIPLLSVSWPPALRARLGQDRREELRLPGDRSLRLFLTLHDAAVDFCERHLRRLERHVKKPTIDGFPSFLHVARSVSKVVADQLERVLGAFETLAAPIEFDKWAKLRENLNTYLALYADLSSAVNETVEKLSASYGAERARSEMLPDIPSLREAHDRIHGLGPRFAASRGRTLRVRNARGTVVDPFVHDTDEINPRRWAKYTAALDQWAAPWREWAL